MPFAQVNPPPYTITTPSGLEVTISPEDEAKFAKKAAEIGIIDKMTRKNRIRNQLLESSIMSVGQAVGFAVGGLLAGVLLLKLFGVPPGIPAPQRGLRRF